MQHSMKPFFPGPPLSNQRMWFVLIGVFLLFSGFLWSRFLLSVGTGWLITVGLFTQSFRETKRRFLRTPFVLWAALFFLSYFISGWWSGISKPWLSEMLQKAPFLFFPIALVNLDLHHPRLKLYVILMALSVMLSGMSYSLWFLIRDPMLLFSGSHLPSPSAGDYIRFTIALVLGLQMIIHLLKRAAPLRLSKGLKIYLYFWFFLAVLYIHIQAPKSGLICLYGLLILHLFYHLFQRKRQAPWLFLGLLTTAATFLWLSVQYLPPITRQWNQLQKERDIWVSGDTGSYETVSSVVPRLVSYQTAWEGIKESPLLGVGAGNVDQAMEQLYQKHFPFIKHYIIVPHNQFIFSFLAVGIPMGLFCFIMSIIPLFDQKRRSFDLTVTTLLLFFGLMIEAMLEVQYGIFVYLFFISFWLSGRGYSQKNK